LTLGETELWQRVVANVDPLHRKQRHVVPATLEPATPAQAPQRGVSLEPEAPPAPTMSGSKAVPAQHPALDRRTTQRLKRGKLTVEGRLDLHGMTQKQAYSALLGFITASRAMNRRLVLVVTGKGWNPDAARPEEAVGVLRRSVPRWLESSPFTQHVASVTDAHAKDGGSGALYVLLRRNRQPRD